MTEAPGLISPGPRTRPRRLRRTPGLRELVAEFGLTVQDVFPGRATKSGAAKAVSKVAAKYRDPATGQTWTGRGKAPKWIDGKDRTPFVIA